MNRVTLYLDDFDDFDSEDEGFILPGQVFRKRNRYAPQARHQSKQRQKQQRGEAPAAQGAQSAVEFTYQPARYEEVWLHSSLAGFFDEELISDVLGQIKGGKEATVYRCQAHAALGVNFVAAKVYRPRMFRNLRNDKLYRQGRDILTADGRPAKKTDHRIMRAIGKKTSFGAQVLHTSWVMHEYTALQRLYQAGAAVPRPISALENAILMSYYGDERRAAPTLNEITLKPEHAVGLFQEVLRNVELMLQHGIIHSDLSAYNILYWNGQITIIDFPQITNSQTNNQALSILRRDIARICEYFRKQGVECDPSTITESLWSHYVGVDLPAPSQAT